MTKRKILITGGAGFLGRNIAHGLSVAGHDVVVLDNFLFGEKPVDGGSIEWVSGDVQDQASMSSAAQGCDFIFHFAGIIGGDMTAEIASAEVIAKAALDNGCAKIVYASSCAVYGRAAMDTAVTEEQPVELLSEYASVKRQNEVYFASLFETHGLSSVMLRYFNPYGPGQDDRMVIPRFIHRALKGETISVFGSGEQIRDFVYIDDAVRATIAAAENAEGAEIVNIASGKETSVKDLVTRIIALTGSASALEFTPAPDHRRDIEVARRIGSTAKLERLTGFAPSTGIKDGLHRTLQSIRENS